MKSLFYAAKAMLVAAKEPPYERVNSGRGSVTEPIVVHQRFVLELLLTTLGKLW